jgi:two-component system, OmpR family, response regulator
MRILIAEDETRVAEGIGQALHSAGFVPHILHDGEEVWFHGSTESYAAVVLDLGLPKLDGLTILKRWRREGITVPVIVLSARGTWSERVEGIDAGADDYLAKPFELGELIARLKALVRRTGGLAQSTVEADNLRLDLKNGTATVQGMPIDLTPLEFRLLHYLAVNKDRPVPQTELAENLYSFNHEREANAVEAAISRLRKKLGTSVIGNKRGFGYYISTGVSE